LQLDWKKYVEIDPRYFRPSEVDSLCGDASKARTRLGWVPQTSFQQLVKIMVDADMQLARRDKLLQDAGEPVLERHYV